MVRENETVAKSYKQLYQKLPAEIVDLLAEQYNPAELDRVFAGFMCERPVTLRVNRLKADVRQVMEELRRDNIKFERVLWYDDALVIKNVREKTLEEHELYKQGLIYLQSLSSMIPPLVLQPQSGAKVLDLTAAPGGKSTQIAALMGNQGYLLANEINHIRAERLKYNVDRQGATIIEVREGDGKRLEAQYGQFFDAVLLDAPCSGVGLFWMENPQTYRSWSLRLMNQLVKEQRKLLETAYWALKPGGVLVYSTCTLTRPENEANVERFLNQFPETVRLEKLDFTLHGAEQVQRFQPIENTKGNVMTITPTAWYEGFFVAKFRKLM